MKNGDFWDFMMEGGDELLNNEACPHCGNVIYLDQKIEWIDEANKIAKCPGCGREVKIDG
jgi:NAD-dependent SIR2 family protein deacetylase